MSTVTHPPPRVKRGRPVPTHRLLCGPSPDNADVLVEIAVGSDSEHYLVRRIPSDFGDGFKVVKGDGSFDHYDVHLSDEGHTCECLGFLAHDHCKHVATCLRLQQEGKV